MAEDMIVFPSSVWPTWDREWQNKSFIYRGNIRARQFYSCSPMALLSSGSRPPPLASHLANQPAIEKSLKRGVVKGIMAKALLNIGNLFCGWIEPKERSGSRRSLRLSERVLLLLIRA